MDDLDRELKQVQLLRERLALQREIERHAWKSSLIVKATGGVNYSTVAMRAITTGFGRLVAKSWKWAAVGGLLLGSVLGALTWKEGVEQAKRDANQVIYEAGVTTYVRSQCEFDRCEQRDAFSDSGCLNDRFYGHPSCSTTARRDYLSLWEAEQTGGLPAPPKLTAASQRDVGTLRARIKQAPVEIASGAIINNLYALESGAFSNIRETNLWITRIKLRLGALDNSPFSVRDTNAANHIRFSYFKTRNEADVMAGKLLAIGLDMAVLDESRIMQKEGGRESDSGKPKAARAATPSPAASSLEP